MPASSGAFGQAKHSLWLQAASRFALAANSMAFACAPEQAAASQQEAAERGGNNKQTAHQLCGPVGQGEELRCCKQVPLVQQRRVRQVREEARRALRGATRPHLTKASSATSGSTLLCQQQLMVHVCRTCLHANSLVSNDGQTPP